MATAFTASNASSWLVAGHDGRRRVKREDISAALSKNITMILEDLLKDYDKTERPAFKQGLTDLFLYNTFLFDVFGKHNSVRLLYETLSGDHFPLSR